MEYENNNTFLVKDVVNRENQHEPLFLEGQEVKLNEGAPSESYVMAKRMIEDINSRDEGPSTPWRLNDFEVGRPLGRGTFGRVYLARERKTHFLVVLKTMFKKELINRNMILQVQQEIDIQTQLVHPNILRLLTYFHDSKRIFLVLEYAALGELYSYIQRLPQRKLPEVKAAKYLFQVADALEYCHSKNVIHRDIKPENLLLGFDDNVKLADFGCSVQTSHNKRQTVCGTLDYFSPEMVLGQSFTASIDLWCLGVLCFEFLVGVTPFEASDERSTYKNITSVNYTMPKSVSGQAQDLIRSLLKKNPSSRLDLSQVKCHPWITTNMAREDRGRTML